MEENILSINELHDNLHEWCIRVVVVEKTLVQYSNFFSRRYQRFVFADRMGNRIQGFACLNDVHAMDETLQLYATYYIGNAMIRALTNGAVRLGSAPFELVLTQRMFVQFAGAPFALPVNNLYHLIPFMNLESFMNSPDLLMSVLGVVIETLPLQIFLFGSRYLRVQEFLLLNQEMRPVVFAIWEDFIDTDGLYLAQNAHQHPIVLICRPQVTNLHGVSLATRRETVVMYNVTIPEALELREWYDSLGGD